MDPAATPVRIAATPVRIRTVTDSTGTPVAVQVDYADWQRMEPVLKENGLLETGVPSLEELAASARPYWQGGDGLEFQLRIRSEWDDRP